MKALLLTTIAGIILASGSALADYKCTSYDGESQLKIDFHTQTRIANTTLYLENKNKKKIFFGQTSVENNDGFFLSKKIIYLYPYAIPLENTPSSLTLVSQLKKCTRAGCDFDAQLKLDKVVTNFVCDEITI